MAKAKAKGLIERAVDALDHAMHDDESGVEETTQDEQLEETDHSDQLATPTGDHPKFAKFKNSKDTN